jgi:hypothetical protein
LIDSTEATNRTRKHGDDPGRTGFVTGAVSQTVADGLLEFLRDHELKLQDGQRLPMSPEILESCFGLFKQLERQHSKGGFTSLLASFGALLQLATPESVRDAFGRVSVKQMRTWVSDNLGTTVPSKRKTAYAESKTVA